MIETRQLDAQRDEAVTQLDRLLAALDECLTFDQVADGVAAARTVAVQNAYQATRRAIDDLWQLARR